VLNETFIGRAAKGFDFLGYDRVGRVDAMSERVAAGLRGQRPPNLLPLRALTVHLAAMTNLDDLDDSSFIIHRVDDPVGTLADPMALGLAGKLLATGRTRSTGETPDSGDDPGAQPARLDGSELFGGGRLDEDAIACHGAEDP
jgi:hypothetical protein